MPNPKEPLSAHEDAWDRINAWPADKPLKAKEAAIFTRFSLSTLSRMRTAGTGPDYFQGGVRKDGSKPSEVGGTNQHVLYFKEDIVAWWKACKVSSTMMAAIRKGQTFKTIETLAEQQPFYIDERGRVESCVEDCAMETVIERLGVWEIEWLAPTEAAARVWSNPKAQQKLASAVKDGLSGLIQAIDNGLEATELNQTSLEK